MLFYQTAKLQKNKETYKYNSQSLKTLLILSCYLWF